MTRTDLKKETVELSSLSEGDCFRCWGSFYEHTGEKDHQPFIPSPAVYAEDLDTGEVKQLADFLTVEVFEEVEQEV